MKIILEYIMFYTSALQKDYILTLGRAKTSLALAFYIAKLKHQN
jgi:hypothetical protein